MQTLFRNRSNDHSADVTSVELFFDLVFVFAVTQVSHVLLQHLTWLGALQAALLLFAVWWAWIDTAWATNWLDPRRALVRLMLFALMGLGLVMSSAIPEAFGARGLIFAVTFALFQVGRSLFIVWAARPEPELRIDFVRFSIWRSTSAVFGSPVACSMADGVSSSGCWR